MQKRFSTETNASLPAMSHTFVTSTGPNALTWKFRSKLLYVTRDRAVSAAKASTVLFICTAGIEVECNCNLQVTRLAPTRQERAGCPPR